MALSLAVLLLLLPALSSVWGIPEARYSRIRQLSGQQYQEDYKVFIDDSVVDLASPKKERPNHSLFSWNFVPSSTEPDVITTQKPLLEGKLPENVQRDRDGQYNGKKRLRRNRNRNEMLAKGKNTSNTQIQEQALDFNSTDTNNRFKDSVKNPRDRKRKNKNRKNKQSRRRSKHNKNNSAENRKRKTERKSRKGKKQKENGFRQNDLPGSIYSGGIPQQEKPEEIPLQPAEEVLLQTDMDTKPTVMRKQNDDELFTQVHQSLSPLTVSQRVKGSNEISESARRIQEISDATDTGADVDGDNTLLPILYTDITAREHTRVNENKTSGVLSVELSLNVTKDMKETDSATADFSFNESSDTYVQFFDENNTTLSKILSDANQLAELQNVNDLFQENKEKEYNALNEIVGDLSCLAGTFLPAPPSPHSAIRYVRTQTSTTANLVAEYECEPKYHLENTKTFQVICSERKWMGTVPSCVPDFSAKEGTACHGGKGSCDHICETKDNRTICTCYKGFRLKNGVCQDINECEIENGGCEKGCRNTPGSHYCICPPGLRLADNRMTCVDVNECLLRNGHGPCQDFCHNKWGGYECSCKGITGTRLAADNHTCQDIDECADGSAGCSHTCLNTFGSAFCLCPSGFMLGDDWKTCQDIDECSYDELQAEQCEFGCVNTIGSYHCLGPQNDDAAPSPTTEVLVSCPAGFHFDFDGTCTDVDECKEKTSGCKQGCFNTNGNFQCYCGLGYKLAADNKTCIEGKEAVCPPLESPLHGYWECARYIVRNKQTKFPWMKRTRVVNHAGAICQLKCPHGYVLKGDYRKTCGQDSKWKGPEDGSCYKNSYDNYKNYKTNISINFYSSWLPTLLFSNVYL